MKLFNLKKPTMYAGLALLIVFTIDLFSPLGIATGVLYLFCFFLVCRQNRKVIIFFWVLTSLLTIGKFIVFYSSTTAPYAIYNRIMTIAVLLIIALLALKHRKLADTINEERRIYIGKLEEMLSLTSHRVRKPVASCLGLMKLLETKQPMTVEELQSVVSHFKASAMELDEFTKELTSFISNMTTSEDKPDE